MLRVSVFLVAWFVVACRPEGSTTTPAADPDSSAELSPRVAEPAAPVDTGRFSITFRNTCSQPVAVYFAAMTDSYVPGEPPPGAESITVPPGGETTHAMDPHEGAWLIDSSIGTTARTAFGEGAEGWMGVVGIASDCRSFAD